MEMASVECFALPAPAKGLQFYVVAVFLFGGERLNCIYSMYTTMWAIDPVVHGLVCYTWELTHGAQLSFEIETIFNVLNSSITDVKRNGALIDFRTAHRCTLHDACLSAITSDSIVHGHMPYFIKEFFRATRRRHTLRCTPLTISVLCVHSVSRFQKHYCSI